MPYRDGERRTLAVNESKATLYTTIVYCEGVIEIPVVNTPCCVYGKHKAMVAAQPPVRQWRKCAKEIGNV